VIAFAGAPLAIEKTQGILNSPENACFQKSQELYGLIEPKQNTKSRSIPRG